jgi:hypothetical protein
MPTQYSFPGKSEGKNSWKIRRRRRDNIRIDVNEIWWERPVPVAARSDA